MMNKIVMMALCLFAFLSLKATGLSGDMINIKGEEWVLLAKPINEDSLLYVRLMDFLPEIVILQLPIGMVIPLIGK